MPIFSALEDLQKTTLKAIDGSLRKLEYLARLRDNEGGYSHWGLSRVYGDLRAKRALADAHRAELSGILATPLRQLEKDVTKSSDEAGVPEGEYLESLSGNVSHLLPPNPGSGSGRHLSSVLHALLSLLKTRKSDANPPI